MDHRRSRDRTAWGWGAAALAAGLALRLVFLYVHPRFVGDTLTYGDLAHNMVSHHVFGFTENVIRPTLIRLPGYPLFLAACFWVFGDAHYLAVLWVQIALDLGACALLGVLGSRLWGRRAGLWVLWLAAMCPFTANYAAAALTETLSLLCVVVALFGLERWSVRGGLKWVAGIGCALAFAVLLRPDEGLLAAAVVPVMVWMGLRACWSGTKPGLLAALTPALLAMLIVMASLLGWAARNWHVFHVIEPLAPRYANDPGEDVPYGFQRWYRTWAIDFKSTVDVYWNYDGNQMRLQDLPPRAFDSQGQRAETAELFARYNAESSATPAFDAAFAKLAAERVAAHPLRYFVTLPVARELNMWLRPRTELMKMPLDWWALAAHPGRSAFEIAYALLDWFYLALGCAGLWRWRRRGWGDRGALAVAMLGFVALRCALLLTVDNSEPRYTLECFPIVMLLAGLALAGRDAPAAAVSD